jgi:hypothetical protein
MSIYLSRGFPLQRTSIDLFCTRTVSNHELTSEERQQATLHTKLSLWTISNKHEAKSLIAT